MSRLGRDRIGRVSGRVVVAFWDPDLCRMRVAVSTASGDCYEVEPDRRGLALAEHLYEQVNVYGAVRWDSSLEWSVRVIDFEVVGGLDVDDELGDEEPGSEPAERPLGPSSDATHPRRPIG